MNAETFAPHLVSIGELPSRKWVSTAAQEKTSTLIEEGISRDLDRLERRPGGDMAFPPNSTIAASGDQMANQVFPRLLRKSEGCGDRAVACSMHNNYRQWAQKNAPLFFPPL